MPSGDGSMMFFELNVTVYSRWPCAPGDSTSRTRPSGLATVTSAAAESDRQNRANGYRIVALIGLLLEAGQAIGHCHRVGSAGAVRFRVPSGLQDSLSHYLVEVDGLGPAQIRWQVEHG